MRILETIEVFSSSTSNLIFMSKDDSNSVVHINVPLNNSDLYVDGLDVSILAITNNLRTLCGLKLKTKIYRLAESFKDERICSNCHSAMGDNAIRIFERN